MDIEEAILNGNIIERQRDAESGEFKYILAGKTFDDEGVEVVAKLGHLGN